MVERLVAFERRVADAFDAGELPYLLHLSGGNEEALVRLFEEVRPGDWVFSTHRNHYHFLLAGGTEDELMRMIRAGRSMFVFSRRLRFLVSSLVAGACAMAAGVAWALKAVGSEAWVWCFIGDGAADQGHYYEAARWVEGHGLPCTFVVEDNDRAVVSDAAARHGTAVAYLPRCVRWYCYAPVWPHAGTGHGHVEFKK
jgi:pyruvate dehydrogenase E1 component alpha subunit